MSFFREISEEYGIFSGSERNLDDGIYRYMIRRKEIAEEMVQICLKNELTVQQSLRFLAIVVNCFTLNPYGSRYLADFVKPVSAGVEMSEHMGGLSMKHIISKWAENQQEKKVLKEIIELISRHRLSIAKMRGAAYEAMLMILQLPVVVVNPESRENKTGLQD